MDRRRQGVHFSPGDYLTHLTVPTHLRHLGVKRLTLDPSLMYMDPGFRRDLPDLLNGLDAFLPSLMEAEAFFGLSGCGCGRWPRRSSGWVARWSSSSAARTARRSWTARPGSAGTFQPIRSSQTMSRGPGMRTVAGSWPASFRRAIRSKPRSEGSVSSSLVIEGTGALFALEALPGLPQARLHALPSGRGQGLEDGYRKDRRPSSRDQRIPSPTFDEQERAEFVRDQFRRAGLDEVHIDSSGNVVARRGEPSAPGVLVSAHLDSVFTRDAVWPARRDGDWLRGPGIGDNALGVAALVELAADLREALPRSCVWFAGTVGEEGLGNLRGIGRPRRTLPQSGKRLPGHRGDVAWKRVPHRTPARRLRISVRTPGGHSWTHAGRPSATHELIRLAEQVLRFPLPSQPRTTMNIGRLGGGTAINAIASSASMEIDLRSEDEQVAAAMEAAVAKHAETLAAPDVQVFTESIGTRPGGGILLPITRWSSPRSAVCKPRGSRMCGAGPARRTQARP